MIVAQHGVGSALDLHKAFGKRTKDWAESHGCVYIFSEQRLYPNLKPNWEKPRFVLDLMKSAIGTDFLWMDPDTWVAQLDVTPVGVLQDWADLAICMDRVCPFNSGLFFIRSNARTIAYMQDVCDKGPIDGARFCDQLRMAERLPYYDIRLQILPWKWNSAHCTNMFRETEEEQPPIIEAYHGWPKKFAFLAMQQNMKKKRVSLKGA